MDKTTQLLEEAFVASESLSNEEIYNACEDVEELIRERQSAADLMTNKHDAEMYELEALGMKDILKILHFVISKRSGNG